MNNAELAYNYMKEEKYLCSQAVLAAFAPELGITKEQALKLGASFGSGMCAGEVCGAVTGALMVLGLKYGQGSIEDTLARNLAKEKTKEFMRLFQSENGSCICRELLGGDVTKEEELKLILEKNLFTTFCPQKVESAASILSTL
jgi:C_GCAxxG_C_C family probable redox protein